MIVTDSLCDILKESTETYENLAKLEYDKYDLMIRDDINRLDEIISKEQVFYLKMKGLEQRRQKATRNINMQDKTLKEIIESSSDEEEKYVFSQANEPLDEEGRFLNKRVIARSKSGDIDVVPSTEVDYMDVSPKQIVSVATAMIPFLENDDAKSIRYKFKRSSSGKILYGKHRLIYCLQADVSSFFRRNILLQKPIE